MFTEKSPKVVEKNIIGHHVPLEISRPKAAAAVRLRQRADF